MTTLIYKIELFSDWHTGSGLAAGSDVDSLVIKDRNNLPYIPGKTLKGLLKDAAFDLMDAKIINEDFITEIFGKKADDMTKKPSIKGTVSFSNGELTKTIKQNFNNKTSYFYRKISSTAIEKNGQAKEHSLRRIEVTIPITLFAEIKGIETYFQKENLKKCMKMVKRLGTWRNRGFGRCEFSPIKGNE